MKVYRERKGAIEETTVKDILIQAVLNQKKYKLDADRFSDGSCSWIGIKTDTQDKKNQIQVVICFEDNDNYITEVEVFKTPYKVKLDEDKTEKII